MSIISTPEELYRRDGELYFQIYKKLWDLGTAAFQRALRVLGIILECFRLDELDELLTTESIIERIRERCRHRFCVTFIQDALRDLEELGIIGRKRQHGRRIITIILAMRGKGPVAPSPPQTPPEEIEETTTTSGPSSSSPGSIIEETEGPKPTAPPELIARARDLVDGVTPGAVADAVGVFTEAWVSRALDFMEKRNGKLGNVRKDWGYVLGMLRTWRKRGDAPEDPRPPKVPSRPSLARAVEEPEPPLTAAQVAELVAGGRQAERIPARMARVQLRVAVAKGLVPAELVATIPPELLERE